MTVFRLIEDHDASGWAAALDGIPHGIAHTHRFASLMARAAGVRAVLFVAESDDSKFVCPFAERSWGGARDIFSPYGFAGFAGLGDVAVLRRAWQTFADVNAYVAAFITQNPLVMPEGIDGTWPGIDLAARTLYRIDLNKSAEERMTWVSARTRSGLRKWLAEASVETDQALLAEAFVRLYPAFAERKAMSELYRFSDEVLRDLVVLPGTYLAGARDADGDVSCVVLMAATPACGDYLFMASSPVGHADGTGVLWCGLEAMAQRDVPVCNLGGGIREGDGVAEFKRRLGGEPFGLCVIRQIFDAPRYQALCATSGCDPDKTDFFPAYYR
jgi:hypothetical protein